MKLPETLDEIMLMQPNNVTFGHYDLNEIQENILTLIIDAIQQHVSSKKELSRDLFNQPYVEIICDEAGGLNNKSKVKQHVRSMYTKEFKFNWKHPNVHKDIETSGTLVTTMHDIKGTNRIVVNFNPWAIPFLLYYGNGVGGTRFNKATALKLRGDYTKRIYKFICSQRDKTEYHYSIERFRDEMQLSEKYTNTNIVRKILIPAETRIKESNSDVWFEFELYTKKKIKGRKPKADTILFKIKTLHPKEAGGEQFQIYNYVYRWLTWCWNDMESSKTQEYADKLVELGKLEDVYKRCCWYDDQFSTGAKTREHCINSLRKMLRDEYQME